MKLEHAIMIAAFAHQRQTDKGGQPYILHPLRVMSKQTTNDARVVAVLHDVIEDTDYGYEDLTPFPRFDGIDDEEGLTETQLEALKLVTREKGITYFNFIRRIRDSKNEIAMAVKLADIGDNTDPKRTAALPPDVRKGMGERYKKALEVLRGVRK